MQVVNSTIHGRSISAMKPKTRKTGALVALILFLLAGCAVSEKEPEQGECAVDETWMKDGNTGQYFCASKWEHEAILRGLNDEW